MNDILLNIRDENSSTVTIKVFIPLNFLLKFSIWCNQKTKEPVKQNLNLLNRDRKRMEP